MRTHRTIIILSLAALLAVTAAPSAWATCPGGGTIDVRVSANSDDAEEYVSSGNLDWGSSDLELGQEGSAAQIVGMRFTNITIPQGATISNAYIQFTVDETDSGTTNLTIRGELSGNAATFANFNSNISNRPKTSASVAWNNVPAWGTVGAAGPDQRTPDLSPIVQEIVNQGTWASGNALVILVEGSGERTAESHEGAPASAPLLHVEYTTPPPPPPPPFTPCNWQRRRKLTFNNSAQAENLVNFPVLVLLDSGRIDYGNTQNAGQDLRFTDSDGVTLLAHEIEKWNEAGTSVVWVKVPQIDASSTTDHIWMYYGNASVADGQDAGAVWSNGYAGVWHLGEASNSTRQDSTCNNNDVADVNTVAATTGKIGDAANFVAASTEYLTISDAAQTGLDLSTQVTLEAWAKPASTSATRAFNAKHGASGQYAYELRLSSDRFTFILSFDGVNRSILNGVSGSVSAGTWYYSAGTYDGSTLRLYRNGSQENSLAASGTIFNSTAAYNIGGRNNGTQPFDGTVDEVRVSSVARSAAWIAAQHRSMSDTFITFGPEEPQESSVSHFTPDAAAAGMHIPVTFVGSFCAAPTVTTSSDDIVVGPSILTDATGAVVTENGKVLTTLFFVKPEAGPQTGVTVSIDGQALGQTFDLVMPAPDPNITSNSTLGVGTQRNTWVLGGLTLNANLKLPTTDPDGVTAGNQAYLPATILVKGDVKITGGTLDGRGSNGTDAVANCIGGDGGIGGPGGGGGGGGGMSEAGCPGGGPPPVVDSVSTAIVATGESSKTVSHTTSGSNRLMIVGVSIDNRELETVASVTYNGVPLSLVGTATEANDARVELWRLIAPPTGTYNVVVTFTEGNEPSPAGLNRAAVIGVITFTGVDQTTPLGTMASANGKDNNLATVNVSSAANELVLGVVSAENATSLTVGPGQTEYWNVVSPAADDAYGAGSTEPGASTVTISWTLGVSNQEWAIAGLPIKPAPGPPTAAPGGAGFSGGGGGGSKGTGTGAAGGTGSGAAGSGPSGATGGDGGTAMGGATGGGGGGPDSVVAGGGGGGGGTGNPFGTGGAGAFTDDAASGEGGGGGGAPGTTAGGGGGGSFATAGTRGPNTPDAGFAGTVTGNAQLVPLMGGSGGGGGGPDADIAGRGGGGGGGGGALLIYATRSITVSGTGKIDVRGDKGGNGFTSGSHGTGGGGGGSGGAVLLQAGTVTISGGATVLDTSGGVAGTSSGNAGGGGGGSGRIRIDGLSAGSTVPGTSGSKYIGPVIDTLVDKTVKGRANGGSTVTLYVYDETGAQVSGSPYTTTASSSSGTVGSWTITNVTFPSGTAYLAVKQSSGSVAVFGPGRASKGLHLLNWREVY